MPTSKASRRRNREHLPPCGTCGEPLAVVEGSERPVTAPDQRWCTVDYMTVEARCPTEACVPYVLAWPTGARA